MGDTRRIEGKGWGETEKESSGGYMGDLIIRLGLYGGF
jgi:hypothetical protein